MKEKEVKTKVYGFFEGATGNKSTTRLVGFITVMYALLQSTLILAFGYMDEASVIATAGASSANFMAIAGPAMIYLYTNKSKEHDSPIDNK